MVNWDKYLEPPDEPEAQYCDGCGEEMELTKTYVVHDETGFDAVCINPFCPDKHTGVAKEIADALADSRATVGYLKRQILHLKRLLTIYDPHWED